MQQAKHTVESKYAVVGSWEDTNVTLTVLENYIPRFFNGAAEEYFSKYCFLVNFWEIWFNCIFLTLQKLKIVYKKQIVIPLDLLLRMRCVEF